jgi:hypothetical protein
MGMNRPGLFVLIAAICSSSGCELLRVFDRPIEPPGKKIKMPESPEIPAKTYQIGQRVDELGQNILTLNTFPGINPLFHTVGVKELVLFHRGTGELFISEGLVEKCKTDEELAAVLCHEMGRMKAEKQAALRVGLDRVGIREVGSTDNPAKPLASADPAIEVGDPDGLARQLMTGAGFDPTTLERVAPLVRDASKNFALRTQMAGSAPAPQWRK